MGLDLRKVAHFVAVAEERSMTRAAARLHLSQQALSMSMRALERELGVPLLDRSRRGVVLLASGEALYADAVPLLAAATAAVGRARRADRGEPELLRIGHTPAVTGIEVTEMLAGAPAHGASVQVVALLSDELDERLRDRSVDVGLSRATAPATAVHLAGPARGGDGDDRVGIGAGGCGGRAQQLADRHLGAGADVVDPVRQVGGVGGGRGWPPRRRRRGRSRGSECRRRTR